MTEWVEPKQLPRSKSRDWQAGGGGRESSQSIVFGGWDEIHSFPSSSALVLFYYHYSHYNVVKGRAQVNVLIGVYCWQTIGLSVFHMMKMTDGQTERGAIKSLGLRATRLHFSKDLNSISRFINNTQLYLSLTSFLCGAVSGWRRRVRDLLHSWWMSWIDGGWLVCGDRVIIQPNPSFSPSVSVAVPFLCKW